MTASVDAGCSSSGARVQVCGPAATEELFGFSALGAEFTSVEISAGLAPVHDPGRLPEEFRGAPNGHEGSHHFLVDDFVTAVNNGSLPPVNAWLAARFTLPGIVAHQSALRKGERLPIRDFGDAPGAST